MPTAKIVVTGPFGAGKTTFIKTISEITVLSTERDVSDHTRTSKPKTTVAMDFGRITIDANLAIYLFGTPGQERFDFMWQILSEGMLGYVLMVDAARQDSIFEAQAILEAFHEFGGAPHVVAVNKANEAKAALGWAKQNLVLEKGVPVMPVDALDRESVKGILLALFYAALEKAENSKMAETA